MNWLRSLWRWVFADAGSWEEDAPSYARLEGGEFTHFGPTEIVFLPPSDGDGDGEYGDLR